MSYIWKYKEILVPEVRIPRNEIRPRNIYRISTYAGGNPITKTNEEARYIFVIGRTIDKIHCIKLNDINPLFFTKFINKIRDKRIPIEENQPLDELLKKFSRDGKILFETYVKPNPQIYSSKLGNYRTYLLKDIINIFEIRFEVGFLRQLFGEPNNPNTLTDQRVAIQREINEKDG
jgi:hypothetical protein